MRPLFFVRSGKADGSYEHTDWYSADPDTGIAQRTTQPGGIGVDDLSDEDFVADGDDLCNHEFCVLG